MSDYIPNPPNDPRNYDKYGNTRFEPVDDSGRGPYILLGILVAIGLIGGLLYFNSPPKGTEQAQLPPATTMEKPMNAPATAPALPPAKPAAPAATPAALAEPQKQ